jgi:hypothetical protein
MSDTTVTFMLYTGLGLVVAILIFAGAFWFATAAKKGNVQFKWRQRRSSARRQ